MASFERIHSWVDIGVDHQNYEETTPITDENTPLSPGEIEIMRNHSKLSAKIYSPSRKSRKSASFTVHSSTSCTAKLGKSLVGSSSGKGSHEKRKTLQVLQPAADGKGILVGSGGAIRRQQKKNSSKPKAKDVSTQRTLQDCSSTVTESSDSDSTTTNNTKSEDTVSDEAFELMVKDPPSERYWQLLAEERRVALHESLEENQKLCKELGQLKERCEKLEEVAGQAEYFASLYSLVMEGEAPSLDESDPIETVDDQSESDADGESDT